MEWEDVNKDIDVWFWVKFIILMGILVFLPVWKFNFVDLSFLYKGLFTIAGAFGVYLALAKGTIRVRGK